MVIVSKKEIPKYPKKKRDEIISVIIVSYNVAKLMEKCLNSLFRETDLSLDIWVVDNNSDDDSVNIVKRNFKQVNLIENNENVGFASAVNQALELCNGDYIFLLNPDAFIKKNSIERMIDFLRANLKAGAVAPKILYPDNSLQLSCRAFPTITTQFLESSYLFKLFPKSKFFGKYFMSWWDHNNINEIDWASGSALMIRREALNKVGFLDEKMFMYSEDIDWCYRCWEKGWKIYYLPEAIVIHYDAQSAKISPANRLIQVLESRYYFFKKHGFKNKIFLLKTIVLLGLIGRIIISFLLWFLTFSKKKRHIRLEDLKTFCKAFLWHFTKKANIFNIIVC